MHKRLNEIKTTIERASLVLLILFLSHISLAQIDTVFWFAAPEITELHHDRPVAFRVTTYESPANIKITLPAQDNKVIAELSVPSNSHESFEIEDPNFLEIAHSAIDNKGIKIIASSPISAYYEVIARGYNTDIYTLKGENALGKEFVLPFQKTYPNQVDINAYHSFQVVATENNTVITAYPTNELHTFETKEKVEITLNKGQVFSFRAISTDLAARLTGTKITSNKPIAVSLSDDCVLTGQSWDLIGDQLIPKKVAGNRYMIPPGEATVSAFQKTSINLNGEEIILDKSNNFSATILSKATILTSDLPVVVQCVFSTKGGYGKELSGAILPPLDCSGSLEVAFTKSSSEPVFLHILFKESAKDDFLLNGKPLNVTSNRVFKVNEELRYTTIKTNYLTDDRKFRLINKSKTFHLAISNASSTYGNKLGYFSNLKNRLSDTITICDRSNLLTEINQSFRLFEEYKIDTLELKKDTALIEITVTDKYCTFVDTSLLVQSMKPLLTLPDTFFICQGKDSILSFKEHQVIFNGVLEQDTFRLKGNTVQVYLENKAGCVSEEESQIKIIDNLVFKMPEDTFLFKGRELDISIKGNHETLLINGLPLNAKSLNVKNPGEYIVDASNKCGAIIDTFEVIETVNDRDIGFFRKVEVQSKEIKIYIWDHELEDQDRINLIFNGEVILSNYTLKNKKLELDVSLKEGKNNFTIYALNLGKHEPNTAAIVIQDGVKEHEFIVESNLNESGAIDINFGYQK